MGATQALATVRIFGHFLPLTPPSPLGRGSVDDRPSAGEHLGFWNAASAVPSPWAADEVSAKGRNSLGQGEGKRDGLTCRVAIK